MKANIYYSASTGAFYDKRVHAGKMPKDRRAVSEDRYIELLEARSTGALIVPDAHLRPQIEEATPPSAEEKRAALIARVKREAGRRIEGAVPLWRQINDLAVLVTIPSTEIEWRDASANRAVVDRYRLRSDEIEAEIAQLDETDLAAFDPRDDALWPVPFA